MITTLKMAYGRGLAGARAQQVKGSRERHRERKGAARRLFPALPHRAKLCRAYGAGELLGKNLAEARAQQDEWRFEPPAWVDRARGRPSAKSINTP